MTLSAGVQQVIKSVAKETVVRKRMTVSRVNGRVQVDSTVNEDILCSVQTPSFKDIQLLPEGARTKTLKKFLSLFEILSEDETESTPADHLVLQDGREFKVLQSLRSEFGVYKAIGVKL